MAELVGILNITPDSFSDDGQNLQVKDAVANAEKLYQDGASIVDVGAESTKPGARPLTWYEEVKRLDGFMQEVKGRGWQISLDTYHPETVKWTGIFLSDFIVNDVTSFRNRNMREVAAQLGSRVIVSHLPRASRDIQAAHHERLVDSEQQVVDELGDFVKSLEVSGVKKNNVILDPGIGFGKTKELNWQLLEFAKLVPDYDVMIGYSRKRFLGENRMEIEPNLAAGKIAVAAGARYLRVHDVKGHAELAG